MPTLIVTRTGLNRLAETLCRETLIGIDTESNNMYVYHQRVCLIQISTRSSDYIVDPLAIDDAAAVRATLGPVFADPRIEKIFHAAEYDIACLKRDFDLTFANLFDTMIAARLCAMPHLGLVSLLDTFFGVSSDKRHQRDNWGLRPLAADALLYAQMDTHYLPDLRDRLTAALDERGQLAEARRRASAVGEHPAARHQFDPEGYWHLVKPNHLRPRDTAILCELYLVRERLAVAHNLPPMRVFNDRALVQLARAAPQRHVDLNSVEALTHEQAYRFGAAILEAVAQGRHAPAPTPPAPPARESIEAERCLRALLDWRRTQARARGVESDLILAKDTLRAIVRRMPDDNNALMTLPGIDAERAADYGEGIIEVLKEFRKH